MDSEQLKSLSRSLGNNADREKGENGAGPGVGLRSSRRLLEAMGSRLRIKSKADKGSRFYFRLNVDGEQSAAYDWKPPQALQQLGIGILSPIALQRRSIRNLLSHWQIENIREFDHDVEKPFDVADLEPCDLLIIDQTESEQAVNDLIDRLRNSSEWRDTRFVPMSDGTSTYLAISSSISGNRSSSGCLITR